MTFPEVAEFTGLIHRKPTPDEIDSILSWLSVMMLNAKQQAGEKIPLKGINEAIQQIIEEQKHSLETTSFVLDMPSIEKRIVGFVNINIMYEDHSDIRNHMADIFKNIQEETGQTPHVLGMKDFNKAVAPHNHLIVTTQYVGITKDGTIKPLRIADINICLQKNSDNDED